MLNLQQIHFQRFVMLTDSKAVVFRPGKFDPRWASGARGGARRRRTPSPERQALGRISPGWEGYRGREHTGNSARIGQRLEP